MGISDTKDDEKRNQCCFVNDGDRCRYIGTFNPGNGKLYCSRHPETGDPDKLVAALEQSIQDVPLDFDYSSKALVDRVRARCRSRDYANAPPVVSRIGQRQWPEKLVEQAAKAKTDEPMSAAARRLYEDESAAERAALQGDGW
jgi:hypothetical protein